MPNGLFDNLHSWNYTGVILPGEPGPYVSHPRRTVHRAASPEADAKPRGPGAGPSRDVPRQQIHGGHHSGPCTVARGWRWGRSRSSFGKGAIMRLGERPQRLDRGHPHGSPGARPRARHRRGFPEVGSSRSSAPSRRGKVDPRHARGGRGPSATGGVCAYIDAEACDGPGPTPRPSGSTSTTSTSPNPTPAEQGLEIADMLIRSGARSTVRGDRLRGCVGAPGRDRGRDGATPTSASRPG